MEDLISSVGDIEIKINEEEPVGNDSNQRRDSIPETLNLIQTGEAKKRKKKEEKSMDNVLKSLNSLETSEEKLQTLCRKYAELLDDHKSLTNTVKNNQRLLSQLNREKDQLQSEHSKAVLGKSKLEGLCRELQRHNKLVKDESIARAKEDDEKRKEVTNKFQTTINEIQQQINEHYERNQNLREENIDLATKLKDLINKYEIREQHIENILKSKEIEAQLFEARMQQGALQLTEQKELFLQEKQKFLQETMENQKRIFILEEQEKAYKSQLEMYTERYAEFQSTLSKSNDVFNTFKSEMEKMSKKMKRLEKDASGWKSKWETSNKTLLLMAEEKALSEKETSLLNSKISRLESLCRALQEERKNFSSYNSITNSIPNPIEDAVPKLSNTFTDTHSSIQPIPTSQQNPTSVEILLTDTASVDHADTIQTTDLQPAKAIPTDITRGEASERDAVTESGAGDNFNSLNALNQLNIDDSNAIVYK